MGWFDVWSEYFIGEQELVILEASTGMSLSCEMTSQETLFDLENIGALELWELPSCRMLPRELALLNDRLDSESRLDEFTCQNVMMSLPLGLVWSWISCSSSVSFGIENRLPDDIFEPQRPSFRLRPGKSLETGWP